MKKIGLAVIKGEFSVCKIISISEADTGGRFVSVSKTDEELSLVCETGRVPPSAVGREDGFGMLKIIGPLDFGLVGVISDITGALAKNGISVFVVSTYDTDYILVRLESLGHAARLLAKAGYAVEGALHEF